MFQIHKTLDKKGLGSIVLSQFYPLPKCQKLMPKSLFYLKRSFRAKYNCLDVSFNSYKY